jgi:2-polyprenyl-3-methyl-5-hydroxy-6-metoxy-1,4-benzoquinol methylase
MRGTGTLQEVFTTIYKTNHWDSEESRSGPGSELRQTEVLRATLPALYAALGVKRVLDAPCGDFNWMRHVVAEADLDEYTGADIVAQLIAANNAQYATEKVKFIEKDITQDDLLEVDLIFCRDCLVHLSNADALSALQNFKRTNPNAYLLSTTYVNETVNRDTQFGKWRPVNLQQAPFYLPEPQYVIDTDYRDDGRNHPGNGMGLWKLNDVEL